MIMGYSICSAYRPSVIETQQCAPPEVSIFYMKGNVKKLFSFLRNVDIYYLEYPEI